MHPQVRNLFKRFILVGRDYPLPPPYVRDKAAAGFRKNMNLASEKEILKEVASGRWMIRELVGVIQLKKYRTLKKRYQVSQDDPIDTVEHIAKDKFGV